jgi:CRP-like cAMP-binding protein
MEIDQLPIHEIYKTFNDFVPLTQNELAIIVKRAKVLKIPKKTKLLKLGETCNKMYFVISGCLRLYYVKGDKERNCFFFHENLFCTAFGSFMMQRPSDQILETIEDTVCLMVTFDEFQEMYEELPKMNIIVRKILEERYTNAHDIISSFILHSAEERYLEFIDKYPLLVNRIPEYHISSYLGITPKSFSRLKGRLHSKRRKNK